MNKKMVAFAALLLAMSAGVFALQRGGPGGGLPSSYTNRSVPLGTVGTVAADRTCQEATGTRAWSASPICSRKT